MKKRIALRAIVAFVASSALMPFLPASWVARGFAAQDTSYSCTQGNAVRKIIVKYSQAGHPVPCEVLYLREGSTQGQTKWSAQSVEGYCEQKAREFAEKLSESGWKCAGGDESAGSESTAPHAK